MKSLLKPVRWVFCFLLIVLLSLPVFAQKGGGSGGSGGGKGGSGGSGGTPVGSPGPVTGSPGAGPYGTYGPYGANGIGAWPTEICEGNMSCPTTTPRPVPATPLQDDPTCFLPPVDGIRSPTISVTRLAAPEKAKQEYEKACSEVHHKKYEKAEEHLQKAINLYSSYTPAWVLLGQVQQMQHKTDDAAESCSRATHIDSGYAPSYLCLAYLDATASRWRELEEVTTQVLQLHPLNASNAYYYNALAYLHLNNLTSAETSARRGVEDSEKNHQPQLHLLLAQIYARKGDRQSEVAELHEYLKRDPHGSEAAQVNTALKQMSRNDSVGQP